jgi:hypothetical protein
MANFITPQNMDKGAFSCIGVKKIEKRVPNQKFRFSYPRQSVKISKLFFRNKLYIWINTKFINARIICEKIIPEYCGKYHIKIDSTTGKSFWKEDKI